MAIVKDLLVTGDVKVSGSIEGDLTGDVSGNATTATQATQDGSGNVIASTYYVPVGTVIWSMATSVPTGFLLCDGSTISRTTYASLFSAIGTTYGTGDGSTTFGLPNLMDRVLQGAGSAGTYRSAGLPNIEGHLRFSSVVLTGSLNHIVSGVSGAISGYSGGGNRSYMESGYTSGTDVGNNGFSLSAASSNSIYGNSTTVQPPALTALPCIKY